MAGLIPQQFIDDLLERSDVVDIVGSRLQLKKTGRNYSALCPFHQEKTASFSVNQEKQFYYCFGCGAGGNSLQFIMDHDRVDFPQAIESLARQHGLDVPREASGRGDSAKQQQRRQQNQTLYELMEKISAFYQRQLTSKNAQHAQSYLSDRGVKQSSVENFELGYSPNSRDALIKEFARNKSELQALINAGMLVENDQKQVYDRFRNRLMFPIRDRRGRIVGFGGRTLSNEKAKYLNSPETALFHKSKELYGLYQARQQRGEPEYMIICEGYMDVIALHQHKINNAVATLGTATNEDHLKILFRYCPNLIFSFDGDEAGQRAAYRAFQILLPLLKDGLRVKFLFLPKGEDPDSIVSEQGKAGFANYIRSAKSFSDYFFDNLIPADADIEDLSFKAQVSKKALPLIDQIPGTAYRQLLLQELQKRTGLDKNTLLDLLEAQQIETKNKQRSGYTQNNTTKSSSSQYSNSSNYDASQTSYDANEYSHYENNDYSNSTEPNDYTASERPKQRTALRHSQKILRLTPAKRALSIILNHPSLALEFNAERMIQLNEEQTLLKEVSAYIQSNPEYSNHRLLGHWLNHNYNQLLLRLLADGAELHVPLEASRSELIDCINHLVKPSERINQEYIDHMAQQRKATLSELEPALQEQIKKLQADYKASSTAQDKSNDTNNE